VHIPYKAAIYDSELAGKLLVLAVAGWLAVALCTPATLHKYQLLMTPKVDVFL
jgi:hypothetical protein